MSGPGWSLGSIQLPQGMQVSGQAVLDSAKVG